MANGIKIGNLDVTFKVGSADCKVYLGDNLLYPHSPTPPVFEGKFKLTLSDSSTVSAECDSTSAVTSGEVSSQYSGTVVSAEIGNCVTTIGNGTFCRCTSLTSITIPNNVTSINGDAFSGCTSLTSITIPSGVTTIGGYAFSKCSGLTSVTIPSGVTYIGSGAFYGCASLTSIDIPSGVTYIGQNVFYKCSGLTSVTIGSGVTSIGENTFANCSNLRQIDIPSGVTSIGSYAFENCTSLTSVTVNAITPPRLYINAFLNTNNCPIYVPSASVSAYKSASVWSNYASRITALPNS